MICYCFRGCENALRTQQHRRNCPQKEERVLLSGKSPERNNQKGQSPKKRAGTNHNKWLTNISKEKRRTYCGVRYSFTDEIWADIGAKNVQRFHKEFCKYPYCFSNWNFIGNLFTIWPLKSSSRCSFCRFRLNFVNLWFTPPSDQDKIIVIF